MPAKQEIIRIVTSLPEDMNFDDILRTLSIINSDRRAMEDIQQGKVFTDEQVLKNLLLPQ